MENAWPFLFLSFLFFIAISESAKDIIPFALIPFSRSQIIPLFFFSSILLLKTLLKCGGDVFNQYFSLTSFPCLVLPRNNVNRSCLVPTNKGAFNE